MIPEVHLIKFCFPCNHTSRISTGIPLNPVSNSRMAFFEGSISIISNPAFNLEIIYCIQYKTLKYLFSAFFGIIILSLVRNGFIFEPSTSEQTKSVCSPLSGMGTMQIISTELFLGQLAFLPIQDSDYMCSVQVLVKSENGKASHPH